MSRLTDYPEWMTFGSAQIKAEGSEIPLDLRGTNNPDAIATTYVERRVPRELEKQAHALIDKFLEDNGFDPEEI